MTDFALRVDPSGAWEDPEAELRSLQRWLAADESLGRGLSVRLGSAPGGDSATAGEPVPGTLMGSGFDLLQLAVGSSLSGASLVFSVLQWQVSRRTPPTLVLSRDGYEIRLTGDAAADPEAVRRIVAALDPVQPAAPSRGDGGSRG
ncbi:effector-associated constant component EACC1 [Streptomyces sp. NBC_00503]|uniref:effector-associated constant component EACC1 n=1 Tax=Streptomyces sp. NBC_00503 TaxID=2903659 RepID=UPI002E807C37|nr:hypothetical protein [Streptomyces sp. NBC_00503]WUD80344.1 hypothetical protein OG490_07110 [Streptomyces sp. NBC_00503]